MYIDYIFSMFFLSLISSSSLVLFVYLSAVYDFRILKLSIYLLFARIPGCISIDVAISPQQRTH